MTTLYRRTAMRCAEPTAQTDRDAAAENAAARAGLDADDELGAATAMVVLPALCGVICFAIAATAAKMAGLW